MTDSDYDPEADAREGHARRMGHDLPMAERRARALRAAGIGGRMLGASSIAPQAATHELTADDDD